MGEVKSLGILQIDKNNYSKSSSSIQILLNAYNFELKGSASNLMADIFAKTCSI